MNCGEKNQYTIMKLNTVAIKLHCILLLPLMIPRVKTSAVLHFYLSSTSLCKFALYTMVSDIFKIQLPIVEFFVLLKISNGYKMVRVEN